jgi:hypothetical protein
MVRLILTCSLLFILPFYRKCSVPRMSLIAVDKGFPVKNTRMQNL